MIPQGVEAKYEILGTLGAGAMGEVLDARDRVIGRRVAIKVVRRPAAGDADSDESYARFRREAQAAGRLVHPHIIAIYEFGEDAAAAWIVMEYADGGSLKDLIDRGERMVPAEAGRLIAQVLDALAYSHAAGVVHRDIKPANLLLTADGKVKLADFGIARIESSTMTQVGTVMGTPSYMAPEQVRGEPTDNRTDLWAVGVVLYQLLTGEKPFEGGGFSMVSHRILSVDPVPPSRVSGLVPVAMDGVIARALAKRADERFPTAAAFAAALEEALRGAGGRSAPLPAADADATLVAGAAQPRPAERPVPAGQAPPRRIPWLPLAGAGGALALAAAGWLLLAPDGGPPQHPAVPPAPAVASGSAAPAAPTLPPATAVLPPAVPVPPAEEAGSAQASLPPAGQSGPLPSHVPPAPPAQEAPVQGAGNAQASLAPDAAPVPVAPVSPPQAARQETPVVAALPSPPVPVAPSGPPPAAGQEAPVVAALPSPPVPVAPVSPPPAAGQEAPVVVVEEALAAVSCGSLSAAEDGDGLRITGIAPRTAEAGLRGALLARGVPAANLRLDITPFDGPFCEVFDILRPAAASPGEPGIGLELLGRNPLVKGSLLRLDVELPEWGGHLNVDYLMSSGQAVHLAQIGAQPAGARFRLGEPRGDFAGWEVDEPFGTDLVVAIASEGPLFTAPRPEMEPLTDYVAALAAAVRAARHDGRRIAARLLVVETVPH